MGKAGEAFNATPLFVYDDTAKLTVEDAKSLHSVAMKGGNFDLNSDYGGNDDDDDSSAFNGSNPLFRGPNSGKTAKEIEVPVIGAKGPRYYADSPRGGFGAPPSDDGIDDASSCEGELERTTSKHEGDTLVFTIKHQDNRSSQWMIEDSVSDECYWQVKVQPPFGTERAPGDGMLIWFEGSYVDLPRDASDVPSDWAGRSTRYLRRVFQKITTQSPNLSLWQEGAGNIISHGHRLNGEETRNFLLVENRVTYADGLSGTPGSNLPTASEPLYISSCCCVLKFSTPAGTGARFTMKACYTGVTPILLGKSKRRRFFLWMCNITEYFMKLAICFLSSSRMQAIAFSIFCLVALVQAIDAALEHKAEDEKARERKNLMMYDKGAWQQLLSKCFSSCCGHASYKAKQVRGVNRQFTKDEFLDALHATGLTEEECQSKISEATNADGQIDKGIATRIIGELKKGSEEEGARVQAEAEAAAAKAAAEEEARVQAEAEAAAAKAAAEEEARVQVEAEAAAAKAAAEEGAFLDDFLDALDAAGLTEEESYAKIDEVTKTDGHIDENIARRIMDKLKAGSTEVAFIASNLPQESKRLVDASHSDSTRKQPKSGDEAKKKKKTKTTKKGPPPPPPPMPGGATGEAGGSPNADEEPPRKDNTTNPMRDPNQLKMKLETKLEGEKKRKKKKKQDDMNYVEEDEAEDSAADDDLLPDGWIKRESRKKPGIFAYIHSESGARSSRKPTASTEEKIIDKWAMKQRRKSKGTSSAVGVDVGVGADNEGGALKLEPTTKGRFDRCLDL